MGEAELFDVTRYVETLRSADVPAGQALASAQALTAALSESAHASLLTKNELLHIRGEADTIKLEIRLLRWAMGAVFAGLVLLIAKSFF